MRIEAEKVEVNNFFENGDVVVAQLTAWSLMIPPEDPGQNPVIGHFPWTYLLIIDCRKDENKEKEAGKG